MLLIAIRKMLSSKWMLLCTLLGSIIAVALLSSIPTYTDGILQKMLTKDLENYQKTTNTFPGSYIIKYSNNSTPGSMYNFQYFNSKTSETVAKNIALPI